MKAWQLIFTIQFLVASVSWLVWYLASQDLNLVYLPQKSFFIPVAGVDVSSPEIILDHLPSWLMCLNDLKIPSLYKIVHHLALLIYVTIYAAIFIKVVIYDFKSPKRHWFWLIALALVATVTIPADSSDIFSYISMGAQQSYFEQNPYFNTVSDIDTWNMEPLLANDRWAYNPSPYGPIFTFISKFLVSMSAKNLWLAFFIFKAFNLLCYLVILYVFAKVLSLLKKNLTWDENKIWFLFALNPLLIIQGLWNAHCDLFLALLCLISVFLMIRKKNKVLSLNLSIFTLACSIFVKYITIVLLPFYLIWIWRRYKIVPYWGLAAGFALGIFFLEYYQLYLVDSYLALVILENATMAHKSLIDALATLYTLFIPAEIDSELTSIFLVGYLVVYLTILVNFTYLIGQSQTNKNLIRFSAICYMILLLIISPKFHSWYLISLLPFAVLSYPGLCFSISIGHLLSITFIDRASILNFLLMTVIPIAIYRLYRKKYFEKVFYRLSACFDRNSSLKLYSKELEAPLSKPVTNPATTP